MIIEKTENGIYKMLDLSELPKTKKGNQFAWSSINNATVPFVFGRNSGKLIVKYDKEGYLLVTHRDTTIRIKYPNFKRIAIGKLFQKLISPEYHKFLVDEDDRALPHQSKKRILCKCPNCDHHQDIIVASLSNQGFNCQSCSTGVSFPERFISGFLTNNGIAFETQKTFSSLKGRRFDFYLPKENILIEAQGEQHFLPKFGKKEFIKTLESDIEKRKFCEQENIILIELDCRKSNFDWIAQQINSSSLLPRIKQEDKVKLIYLGTEHNKYDVKRMMSLYHKGYKVKDISLKTGVSTTTIYKLFRNFRFDSFMNKSKIICVDTLTVFSNRIMAARWAKISSYGNLTIHLNGAKHSKSCGKHPVTGEPLKWMYYEDYVEKYGTEGLTEYMEDKRELL